eukprot:1203823-Rhodomonas_salina.4
MMALDGGAELLGNMKIDVPALLAKDPNLGGALLFWMRAAALMGLPLGFVVLWVALFCPLENRMGAHLAIWWDPIFLRALQAMSVAYVHHGCISLGFIVSLLSHFQVLGGTTSAKLLAHLLCDARY